ncbi:MAG: two-component regulator propeller domain-containing protein [candidate division WOR-3 bacterium]
MLTKTQNIIRRSRILKKIYFSISKSASSLRMISKILALLITLGSTTTLGNWQTYTNANIINDMAISQNRLYCATNGGLVILDSIWDEISFKRIFTNTEGLPQNQLLCLARDKINNLWLGTTGGLAIYNQQTQALQTYRHSALPTKIRSILIVIDTILLASENGFYLIDTRGTPNQPTDDQILSFRMVTHPQLLSDDVLAFANTDSFYWVGTDRGLMRLSRHAVLDTSLWNSYPHPFGDSVLAMAVIFDTLYIATESGIAKFNGSQFIPVLSLPTPVKDMTYRANKFYLATEKGLIRYDFTRVDTIWQEPTKSLLAIDSLLFCGMGGEPDWGHGLRIISDTTDTIFKYYYAPGLASNSVFSVITDNFGSIYACHDLQALSRLSSDGQWSIFYSPLYKARVLAKDSHNRIWLGHFSHRGGLSYFDPKTLSWGLLQWGEYTPRNIINALGIDRNDTKWVWSVRNNFGIVGAIDSLNNQIEFNFSITSPPGRPGCYEFAFDSKNRVWLGTHEGLLMFDYRGTLFNPTDDTWVIFKESAGLPGIEVVSVAIDAKDRVWVGTANGAGVLAEGKFTIINPPFSKDIKKVRVDDWGNIWFLTASGLSSYDPHTQTWTEFNQGNSEIIPNPDPLNLTNFYTCLHIDNRNGFLLVGTQSGLSRFELRDSAEPSLPAVRVFPNPCIKGLHNGVNLESLPRDSKVFIYSLSGKFLTELLVNPSNHRAFFDSRDYSAGIYLVVIVTPSGTRVEKFAIVH